MTNKEKARDYTDEEKAIIYTHNRPIEYSEILSQPYVVDEIRKAYIAGLKAGRPKWHKVADGDLPDPNIAVLICLRFEKRTTTYIAYYRPAVKKWQMYNLLEAQRQPIVDDYIDSEEVIAWREILEYTEE